MSFEWEWDAVFSAGLLDHADAYLDEEIIEACESPIEARFAAAFSMYVALVEGRPMLARWEGTSFRPRIVLQPQFAADPYRLDFIIYYSGTPLRLCGVVVECDGHDFHEKTKAQAARDKERDRFLQARFAKVLRFTGSEIHRRPFECAAEAFGALDGVYSDWGGGR